MILSTEGRARQLSGKKLPDFSYSFTSQKDLFCNENFPSLQTIIRAFYGNYSRINHHLSGLRA